MVPRICQDIWTAYIFRFPVSSIPLWQKEIIRGEMTSSDGFVVSRVGIYIIPGDVFFGK